DQPGRDTYRRRKGFTWKSKPGRLPKVLCISVQSEFFSSILKDFLSMVFFMVFPFSSKISH
ncbi:MAG: hypothetical protein KDK06_06230, partial [Gammaproteobacteria bacterium]|nr:hypothetical protein [Gammaproteobacteria bacterium]